MDEREQLSNQELQKAPHQRHHAVKARAVGRIKQRARRPIDGAFIAISLSDLLDYLKSQQRWDANAVAVHLRACRLLLHTEGAADAAGTQAILAGLRKVSQRYAKPE